MHYEKAYLKKYEKEMRVIGRQTNGAFNRKNEVKGNKGQRITRWTRRQMGKEVSKTGIVTPWKQTQDFTRKVYFSLL